MGAACGTGGRTKLARQFDSGLFQNFWNSKFEFQILIFATRISFNHRVTKRTHQARRSSLPRRNPRSRSHTLSRTCRSLASFAKLSEGPPSVSPPRSCSLATSQRRLQRLPKERIEISSWSYVIRGSLWTFWKFEWKLSIFGSLQIEIGSRMADPSDDLSDAYLGRWYWPGYQRRWYWHGCCHDRFLQENENQD